MDTAKELSLFNEIYFNGMVYRIRFVLSYLDNEIEGGKMVSVNSIA